MENISSSLEEGEELTEREIFFQRERTRNRVFSELVSFFALQVEDFGVTKKVLAERLGKDPAQLTRWLSYPSNFTLDTLSDLLLAMGSELDCRAVRFADRAPVNFAHDWAVDYGHVPSPELHISNEPKTNVPKVTVKTGVSVATGTSKSANKSVYELGVR
jgi:hypothetical protein